MKSLYKFLNSLPISVSIEKSISKNPEDTDLKDLIISTKKTIATCNK